MDLTTWTDEHLTAALREGWVLSDSTGSENGPLQVQRVDDPDGVREADPSIDFDIPHLESDDAAWEIIRSGVQPHHFAARQLLEEYNPAELALILAEKSTTQDVQRA